MCGRFTLRTPAKDITEAFNLDDVPDLQLRFNIAPSQDVAAVRLDREGIKRELAMLRWGLIPFCADDPKTGYKMIVRKPGEGRRIGIVGDVYRFLATGEETDGKYATFEAIAPPGGGPPSHIHSREEESFVVLEGQMTFQLGDERFVAEVRTFLNTPVGSLHSFKNESDKQAKLLISVVPAGLEKMFFEVGQPVSDDAETAPPPTQADIEKLLEAAPRYGIEIRVPQG